MATTYITVQDLIDNGIITNDDNLSPQEQNWIVNYATQKIDILTSYKIQEATNNNFPTNLSDFQKGCIIKAAIMLARQVITYGIDDLTRGNMSISMGDTSLNQSNPNDPYYIHPDVYDLLTSAGFYKQVFTHSLTDKRYDNKLTIDTPMGDYNYITRNYLLATTLGKPFDTLSNKVIAGDGISITFNGDTTTGIGATTFAIDTTKLAPIIAKSILDQLPNIKSLILDDDKWEKEISAKIEAVIQNDNDFKNTIKIAIEALISGDTIFITNIATILSTNTDFINKIIKAILPSIQTLMEQSWVNLVETKAIPSLDNETIVTKLKEQNNMCVLFYDNAVPANWVKASDNGAPFDGTHYYKYQVPSKGE